MSRLQRFSIIVATYNAAQTLTRCLDSVLSQTYPAKELIVIDGGSTDGTVATLQAYSDRLAYWESEEDRGIYHAWNKGLAHTSGDWVCFLGADDFFWKDDVLENMAVPLNDVSPAVRVVYGRIAVVGPAGAVLRYEGRPWPDAKKRFTSTMNIPHPGLMHHRSLFEEHGRFDESLRIAADYDFLLRELRTNDALFVPHVTVVGMQHGGLSYSPTAMPQMLLEQARIREKHGLPPLNDWRSMSSVLLKMNLCNIVTRCLGEKAFRSMADVYRRLTGRRPVWR